MVVSMVMARMTVQDMIECWRKRKLLGEVRVKGGRGFQYWWRRTRIDQRNWSDCDNLDGYAKRCAVLVWAMGMRERLSQVEVVSFTILKEGRGRKRKKQ